MNEAPGILWALQVIVGPLVLGIALAYGAFQYRRRRRQGELNSAGQIVAVALPVVIAVALFTFVMMIPGSQ
jgi:predicted PurR-regulated permease PerM